MNIMSEKINFQITQIVWLSSFLVIIFVLAFAAKDSLIQMEEIWRKQEEYGYAYMIPAIAFFFIWQRLNDVIEEPWSFSWRGFVILLFGILVIFIGVIGSARSIAQYGFVIALIGACLQYMGWKAFRKILVPMLMLFLMVPLPSFIYAGLSSQLQLISSKLGVYVIRLFDISVYLEGNVIDLGNYKLQVVEACSGLRYLFPLFSLSVIAAYIYRAKLWKRLVIVLSSIPITVLMNSFRIGAIGVLVEYGGIEQAEGFLHDFEGWVIFIACTALLVFEMWLLTALGNKKKKLSDVFAIEFPSKRGDIRLIRTKNISGYHFAPVSIVLISAFLIGIAGEREDVIPARKTFDEFPIEISGWKGKKDRLDSIYLDALQLDDYLLIDYTDQDNSTINLHIAYYSSQHGGVAAHSPRTCLPGGGWKIEDITRVDLDLGDGMPDLYPVNRVIITQGNYTQLVYYWFKQRDRVLTNEYIVKWYLFWDALTRKRTDGALVRLTVFVGSDDEITVVEDKLKRFLSKLVVELPSYIPN